MQLERPSPDIEAIDVISAQLQRVWTGWAGSLLTTCAGEPSLLEPMQDVGLLQDVIHLAVLGPVDLARLFLCTCHTLRKRMLRADDVTFAILQHRKLGLGSSAMEVSARCRHAWQYNETRGSPAGAHALRWLHEMEGSVFEDFGTPDADQSSSTLCPWMPRHSAHKDGFVWAEYGELDDAERGDRLDVESVSAADGDNACHSGFWEAGTGERAQCISLRISKTYGQSRTHFGRGVQATFPQYLQLRPTRFSCLFRLRLDLFSPARRRRQATIASVGYLILSDGLPTSSTAHGVFGTEALFVMVLIGPNHRAKLMAVDGDVNRTLVPELRIGSWVQLHFTFDWERERIGFRFLDFASASWPEEGSQEAHSRSGSSLRMPQELHFRGACRHVGQLTLTSVSDQGHATCAWTDIAMG